jgi:nucleoside-diphosphate-sugar epimerase
MKVLIIGGTGLLGSEAARELIARGHEVAAVALPPVPSGAPLPPEMKLELGNCMEMTDEALRRLFAGCEGFVFAAGVDERVEGPPPIYEMFWKYNIAPLERLLRIAKACGVRHCVVCGSYFCYFDRLWPHMRLSKWHPYIRSRKDQEDIALSFGEEGFDVAVLELPYIFGAQPGRKPVWLFLVEMIRDMKKVTMYPKGGTAMVTVKQVGQAIAGALERNRGGRCYPIGYYNRTWTEMLKTIHRYMGCPGKRIVTIPKWLYRFVMSKYMRRQKAAGYEGGLNLVRFTDIQCARLFIDKALGSGPLGVTPDDMDAAIGESVRLCMDVLNGRVQAIGMKGE